MNEALNAQQLLAAGASGALMVMFAAFYAFFYSINFLKPSPYWPLASIGSFLMLVTCSVVLALALKLTLLWQIAIGFILICYYFSPRLIWRLTVATHVGEHDKLQFKAVSSNSAGGVIK